VAYQRGWRGSRRGSRGRASLNRERAASELHVVEGVNGATRRMALWHLDEAKAAGAAGLAGWS
jgi:hypothetical protein